MYFTVTTATSQGIDSHS